MTRRFEIRFVAELPEGSLAEIPSRAVTIAVEQAVGALGLIPVAGQTESRDFDGINMDVYAYVEGQPVPIADLIAAYEDPC